VNCTLHYNTTFIKWSRIRRAGNPERKREEETAYTVLVKKPVESRPLGTPDTERKLLLKWLSKKQDRRM
jgi:hypothetical protein